MCVVWQSHQLQVASPTRPHRFRISPLQGFDRYVVPRATSSGLRISRISHLLSQRCQSAYHTDAGSGRTVKDRSSFRWVAFAPKSHNRHFSRSRESVTSEGRRERTCQSSFTYLASCRHFFSIFLIFFLMADGQWFMHHWSQSVGRK